MRVRAMPMGQLVGPLAAHRDLQALNRIQHQQPQLAVENVQIEYLTEARIGFELMLAIIGFKRESVRPKAIVIDVLEVEFSPIRVINHHAALLKQLDLLDISSG